MHYLDYGKIPMEEKWEGFTLSYPLIEGFSDLFYEKNGNHVDLDYDADVFLEYAVKNHWRYETFSPETYYINALMAESECLVEASDALIKNSSYYQSTSSEQWWDDFENDLLNIPRTPNPDEVHLQELVEEDRRVGNKIKDFIPTYLRTLVEDGIYCQDSLSISSPFNSPYFEAIIQEPGKYLLSYFHDQMVFMNYVQYIVYHRGSTPDMEENLLSTNQLLDFPNSSYKDLDLDYIFYVVSRGYQGWWT